MFRCVSSLAVVLVCFLASPVVVTAQEAAKGSVAPAAGKLSAATVAYPPLPKAVSSFGAASADGYVYIYGGHVARTHTYSTEAVLGTFHRLKLADPKAWEELPSGPGVQGLALVAHGGKIYRLGGMQPRNKPDEDADNHSIAACARFDPKTGKWEKLPDLPEGRSSHDAVVVGDRIIVVGGWRMNGSGKKGEWFNSGLVLDLKQPNLKWQIIEQPFVRRALIAAVHQDKVYVIGGLTRGSGTELTVNIYDPAKNAWSTGPELPEPRRNGFSPAACELSGSLYVSQADGKVLRLSGKGDAWEEAGNLKQPRIVHRMLALDANVLMVLGGANKGDNIALTEALTR